MSFTAADVKALRDQTGAGMMDCKKALTEADGDAEKAAEKAAAAWDTVAEELARLVDDHRHITGYDNDLPLETVAKEIGLDASAWVIDSVREYTYDRWRTHTPVVGQLHALVTQQRARLREVADLAGDRESV